MNTVLILLLLIMLVGIITGSYMLLILGLRALVYEYKVYIDGEKIDYRDGIIPSNN